MNEHNYIIKISKLVEQGKLLEVGVHLVKVSHDNWCNVIKGNHKYCNCDPDISLDGKKLEPDRDFSNPN